jgi:hypothetical protein
LQQIIPDGKIDESENWKDEKKADDKIELVFQAGLFKESLLQLFCYLHF